MHENRESTARQYDLKRRAQALGWTHEQIVVIDEDLGLSGASGRSASGFQRLVAEVGLGRAGVVMGLEVSRLARNSTDWHRLLEICALAETLILDEDGIYDPTHFNDRLLLGLKGTMSEAELHVLRARLLGGLLNKARRGELWIGPPIGYRLRAGQRDGLRSGRADQGACGCCSKPSVVPALPARSCAISARGICFPRRLAPRSSAGEIVLARWSIAGCSSSCTTRATPAPSSTGGPGSAKLTVAQARYRRLPRESGRSSSPTPIPATSRGRSSSRTRPHFGATPTATGRTGGESSPGRSRPCCRAW